MAQITNLYEHLLGKTIILSNASSFDALVLGYDPTGWLYVQPDVPNAPPRWVSLAKVGCITVPEVVRPPYEAEPVEIL